VQVLFWDHRASRHPTRLLRSASTSRNTSVQLTPDDQVLLGGSQDGEVGMRPMRLHCPGPLPPLLMQPMRLHCPGPLPPLLMRPMRLHCPGPLPPLLMQQLPSTALLLSSASDLRAV
jgi:hypothetical protein